MTNEELADELHFLMKRQQSSRFKMICTACSGTGLNAEDPTFPFCSATCPECNGSGLAEPREQPEQPKQEDKK